MNTTDTLHKEVVGRVPRSAAWWCAALTMVLSVSAQAEICAYESDGGKLLYTNVSPGAGWKKRECFASSEPPATPKKSGGASSSSPSPRSGNLSKVTSEKQKERDSMRRKVLENELATESKSLEEARAIYANGAPPALPEEFLNPQKYGERLARLRETIELHERNVDALKKEIAKM